MLLAWLAQLVASLAWLASLLVYASWGPGDILQLVAATSWTVANAAAAPEAVHPLYRQAGEGEAVEMKSVKTEV